MHEADESAAGAGAVARPGSRAARRETAGLALLIAIQAFCALWFLLDVVGDLRNPTPGEAGAFFSIEALTALAMIVAIGVEARQLRRLILRQQHLSRALDLASGALNDILERWYTEWGLTPAEQDVAGFTLKGFELAEIARLRGTAEGTVKAQLNAIYRKSGRQGRAALLALVVEELMGEGGLAPGSPRQ
ncbi:helix-turn-helix transcriptional regulator [Pseudoroseicyclus sp. H15]